MKAQGPPGFALWGGLGGVCRLRRVQSSAGRPGVVEAMISIGSMGLVYLPKFTITINQM